MKRNWKYDGIIIAGVLVMSTLCATAMAQIRPLHDGVLIKRIEEATMEAM